MRLPLSSHDELSRAVATGMTVLAESLSNFGALWNLVAPLGMGLALLQEISPTDVIYSQMLPATLVDCLRHSSRKPCLCICCCCLCHCCCSCCPCRCCCGCPKTSSEEARERAQPHAHHHHHHHPVAAPVPQHIQAPQQGYKAPVIASSPPTRPGKW